MLLLTPTHKFILFTLGFWYTEANKKLQKKNLIISISKASFIQIVKKAGIVEKKPRALYKNLELLEKKKLIKYEKRSLSLTEKGEKIFLKIYKEHKPYVDVVKLLAEKEISKYTKKLQTRFL